MSEYVKFSRPITSCNCPSAFAEDNFCSGCGVRIEVVAGILFATLDYDTAQFYQVGKPVYRQRADMNVLRGRELITSRSENGYERLGVVAHVPSASHPALEIVLDPVR